MDQKGKELITNKTSLTTQPSGLASRGLQIAKKLAEQKAKTVKQLIDEPYFTNSLGMKFRLIPAGTFIMGSPETEEDRFGHGDQHHVTVSKVFWMGVHEVTQKQYEKVMGTNPSYFQGNKVQSDSSNYPVEKVSWDDAEEFCKKLSDLPEEKKAGREYRLPTEAEWEYACRAGSSTLYCFGDDKESLEDYAWYSDNSSDRTHTVGLLKPNAWDLYDMHGNVWEWCSDWYGEYPKGVVIDPTGLIVGSERVIRGGSWIDFAADCRSAIRFWYLPSHRNYSIGFRVALSSSEIPKSPDADK